MTDEPVAIYLAIASSLGLAWAIMRLRRPGPPRDRAEQLRQVRLLTTVAALAVMVLGFGLNGVGVQRLDGVLNTIVAPLLLLIATLAVVERWSRRRAHGVGGRMPQQPPTSRTEGSPRGQSQHLTTRSTPGSPTEPFEDPGWMIPARWVVLAPLMSLLLPFWARRPGLTLIELRGLFVSQLLTLGLILVVLTTVLDGHGDNRPLWPLLLVIGATVHTAVVLRWSWRRPLPHGDAGAFAAAYRARLLLGLSLATAIAMFGFVGSFVWRDWRLYLLALVPSMIGFIAIAPTRASLERLAYGLRAQGATFDPLAVLNGGLPRTGSE